ncbi:methylisocitrate lyase [Chthoniobacter flavus Ellin428]|uniref:Methylisocitrate lyase n=2 Tax=Chthoniobacter flavus TaxID=191863 RepID=B4D804_9BACT|nr:methylisocitrate lyase [Chthoniobacter flavus Ellin428]TCO87390.1 methylisocitrate lyase [Chthoniobacter flavus]
MPGAFNAATARLVERAGFEAVYVSGAGLANATVGVPDIGLLSLAEVAQLAGYIARAVRIPALVDADTGFGGPANTAKAVRAFERAGLAGMHLEDQVFPKRCGHLAGKEVVSGEEMTAKLRAAVEARTDPDFLIIARTDARAVEGFDQAVKRAKGYLDAGADGIFPEALETPREFREFAKKVRAPLMANITEFGRSPLLSVRQLAKMGYRMVLFPLTAFRVSMQAAEECLRDLRRRGTQRSWIDRMQTRAELYELLGYDPISGDFSRGD